MEKFHYLLTIVGVIVGLALTHLLAALSDYLQHRSRVTWSWLPLAWMAILLVFQIQYWWTLYTLGGLGNDFTHYCCSLAYPTLMYLASSLIAPKVPPEPGYLDMSERYFANHRWFFLVCSLAMVTLIFHDCLLGIRTFEQVKGFLTHGTNLFRLPGLGLTLVLILFPWRWLHHLLTLAAVLMTGFFLTYVK